MASGVSSLRYGERPTVDCFKPCKVDLNTRWDAPREDNHQAVPKNPQAGIKVHGLWCRLSGIPREAPGLTIHHR
jgi:hypothetical protein